MCQPDQQLVVSQTCGVQDYDTIDQRVLGTGKILGSRNISSLINIVTPISELKVHSKDTYYMGSAKYQNGP